MGHPPTPSPSLLVDHFGNCYSSTNPSAAPLGLMLTYCLPWVWFCAPRHLWKAPTTPAPLTHAHLITSNWSIGFYSPLSGPGRARTDDGLQRESLFPTSPKLDYLFPILAQSSQLESSSPTDRWLCIARKNIFPIKSWIFKSQIPSTSNLLSKIPRPIVGLKSTKLCTQLRGCRS